MFQEYQYQQYTVLLMFCKKTFVSYLLNSHKNTALDGHIHCVHKVDYNETQHIRNSANAI